MASSCSDLCLVYCLQLEILSQKTMPSLGFELQIHRFGFGGEGHALPDIVHASVVVILIDCHYAVFAFVELDLVQHIYSYIVFQAVIVTEV